MTVDSHTHLGRNEHISANVDQLLKSMDAAYIDKALVFAGALNDLSNEDMLKEIAPHTDRLLGVASANPILFKFENGSVYASDRQIALYYEKEEIKKIKDWYGENKIVATKFYTGYDHYFPSDAYHYLQNLEEVGCPAIFHSGDCLNSVKCAKLKYAHPLHIDEVAVDFPKMNFVIAHMGYPWVKDAAEVCYKNANVYSDISGFVYGKFKGLDQVKFKDTINEFLNIAGSDKLLFGSDWPISDQRSYVSTVDDMYGEALTVQYLTRNAQRAFKL